MSPTIRAETAGDAAAIRRVTDAAFAAAEHASGTEGAIVDALRAEGSLALSPVAVDEGAVIGHVAFSPMTVADGSPGRRRSRRRRTHAGGRGPRGPAPRRCSG